jgi:hypothetical protein
MPAPRWGGLRGDTHRRQKRSRRTCRKERTAVKLAGGLGHIAASLSISRTNSALIPGSDRA